MNVKRYIVGIFAAMSVSMGFAMHAAAKENVNIGICVSWPGYAMFEVVNQKNLAPDYNLNLTIFEDPIGGHSALAAGQIDIYLCTGDYTPLTIDSNTPVANVAFLNPSYGVDHIIISPNENINELKGKKVSAPQAYIGHLLMGLFLDKNGISPDDVEWVNLNADEAVGPMMSGDLAVAYMYEPWISTVIENSPGTTSVIDTANADMLKDLASMLKSNNLAGYKQSDIVGSLSSSLKVGEDGSLYIEGLGRTSGKFSSTGQSDFNLYTAVADTIKSKPVIDGIVKGLTEYQERSSVPPIIVNEANNNSSTVSNTQAMVTNNGPAIDVSDHMLKQAHAF